MTDEKGPDAKLITVLAKDPVWDSAAELEDVPGHLLDEIAHFFSIYKDLEPGKMTETRGFEGRQAALEELSRCRVRATGVDPETRPAADRPRLTGPG